MHRHFRFATICFLLLFCLCIPSFFAQDHDCLKGGKGTSQTLSGTWARFLPNNPVREYSIARIRDTGASILEFSNGDLLAVWAKFTKNGKDDSAGWIVGRRSKDKGKTWGTEFPVTGVIGMLNSMAPSLLLLPNGDALLFILAKHDQFELDIIMWRSSDNGYTWNNPIEINEGLQQAYHVMNNDRVIQLEKRPHKGRIICPISFSTDISASTTDPTAFMKCMTFYSDDEGKTWNKSEVIHPPDGYLRGLMEPGVVELENGDVMMLIRTRNQEILKTVSSDGGESWGSLITMRERPEGDTLVTTSSPSTIKRIPCTGDLLMIYNNGIDKKINQDRTHLVYRISKDDGESWGPMGTLAQGNDPEGFAYASIAFVEENALITYYVDIPADSTDIGIRTFETELRIIPVGWFYGISVPSEVPKRSFLNHIRCCVNKQG
jgi:hypothetical protein